MKAKQLDKDFDEGKDISAALDLSSARRPNQKRVNVDFPNWMVEMLDREAMRLGVTRQSIIKIWLAERLEQLASFQSMQSDEKKNRAPLIAAKAAPTNVLWGQARNMR